MKISYSIENIRRISDIPQIEMRPITILVGRNSAGKSTYLRTLPLIRQSLETRSSAPILWYGDLVDFGDPSTAIGAGQSQKQAAFHFTISDVYRKDMYPRSLRPHLYVFRRYFPFRRTVKVREVSIRYVIGAQNEETILRTIEVRIPHEKIEVRLDFSVDAPESTKVTINGELADFLPRNCNIGPTESSLFSVPYVTQNIADGSRNRRSVERRMDDMLADELLTTLKHKIPRKLGDSTYRREVGRILSANPFDQATIQEFMESSDTASFKKLYQNMGTADCDPFVKKVFSIQRLARAFAVMDVLEDLLAEHFLNVAYLKPVRAASERFYRKQELEVSEIAPNGSNFPMFLASLSKQELSEFSIWVEAIFGYGVGVHSTEGHISVHLHSGSRSVNVTDTGYGVSQILPVLGMIWWAKRSSSFGSTARRYRSGVRTLAIEQPELHLHPAHQAKLADVFVAAVRPDPPNDGAIQDKVGSRDS